jgi:uncharacterized membrane protein YhhN
VDLHQEALAMANWLFLPLGILLITLPIFLMAEFRSRKQIILPLKMICSLSFIAIGVLGILLGGEQAPTGYQVLMVIGMIFSLLGDLALVWKEGRRPFMLGLGAFLLAQALYSAAFSLANGFSAWDALFFALLVAIPITAYRFLDMDVGKMKIPVIAYMVVIAFMFAKALSSLYLNGITMPAGWLVPLGGGLFYLSDGFIALYRFHRKQPKVFRALNLPIYYVSQALLAVSLFYF